MSSDKDAPFLRVLEAEIAARDATRARYVELLKITPEDVARWEADYEAAGLECPWKPREPMASSTLEVVKVDRGRGVIEVRGAGRRRLIVDPKHPDYPFHPKAPK